MSNKSKDQMVKITLISAVACIVLVGLWAILAISETGLAAPPDRPGGNVVKQDIPAILTLDGGSLTNDGGSYSNLENGISCWVGRRRSIWVTLSKNSPRSMNLALGSKLVEVTGDPTPGCDPWGVEVMTPQEVQDLDLPDGPIDQVDLHIARFLNVSGLGDEDLGTDFPYCEDIEIDSFDNNTMCATTDITFLDASGDQWGLYFGIGKDADGDWGGGRIFTRIDAPPVKTQRTNPGCDPKRWIVEPQTTLRDEGDVVPGFLWFRGSKKNASWVFVGVFNVPWSCVNPGDVKSLE